VKLDLMSKTAPVGVRFCHCCGCVLTVLWLGKQKGKKKEDVNEMMRREGPSKTIVSCVVSPRPVEVARSVAA
jgi:hypothetical protein